MQVHFYHGSPRRPFSQFDPATTGSTSGLKHARGAFFFSSEMTVAEHYAKPGGFVGQFAVGMSKPLDMPDEERDNSIGDAIEAARSAGHDGIILRGCVHSAISPGMRSDIAIVFSPEQAIYEEVVLDLLAKS